MKCLCVIPSRIGSTRLPRKPLLPIKGKPMVQWVYENARSCPAISEVIVATDSEEIAAVIQAIDGNVMLTPSDLPTGSDRVAFAASCYPDVDVVINLQGDEPFVTSTMLLELITPYLEGESPSMTTLAYPLRPSDYHNPDIVKVILDRNNHAIYFSRSPIPFFRTDNKTIAPPVYHHVGLYAFKRDFLKCYTQLAPTPLEQIEMLEQLRAIENGYKIKVCLTAQATLEINTFAEYEQAELFADTTRVA